MILGVEYKMRRIFIILFFAAIEMFAQHQDGLMVMPRNIHFESDFDRMLEHIKNGQEYNKND